ncbi:MAG: isoamylase early set domain-containing protein [Acidimicrobiales bacterium]
MPSLRSITSTDSVEVTFALDRPDATEVAVALADRDWAELPMRRYPTGSGPWYLTLRCPPGTTVEYRYLVDGTEWVNDPAAHDERPNGMGGTNSVVVTPVPD